MKINKKEPGVWRYAEFYNELIRPENRLSLGGGSSREIEVKEINKLLNIEHLYFKREDENTTGSLKDRSLAYQVSLAKQNNKKELIIPTSGNAGISAAAYCAKAGIKLYVFISPETEKAKISEMQKYNPIIVKSKKAIKLANYLSAKYKIENLRPSINDSSIEGFKSIAFEIFENLGKVGAIFTFVTSGSSFVGIGRAYQCLLKNNEIKKMPALYAVQSGNIFSVAGEFGEVAAGSNPFHFLGAKNTRRKEEIMKLINLSGGSGIYAEENEISQAGDILKNNGILTSPEGQASLAGVIKAGEKNNFNKVVCILSGKARREGGKINEEKIYRAESFEEIDEIVKSG